MRTLTDPNDLAIFKAAESLWMELAGTDVILDVETIRAKNDIDPTLGDLHQTTKEHEEFVSEIQRKHQHRAEDSEVP